MVRLVMKGGVWKNSEDAILQSAIMKYGKTQWARVASLLPRKTAKACKARWYEWLDPSIKKTEWTAQEEEKLLHLAKLMPAQWRTIAPLVGRTATQCLQHYEKLLDVAQGKEVDPRDDPRRLAPGEIDPLPEAKPARPDPIDMDEDEKEMLSEARARLANTRGKKAKRKAREKQLEEARRLASLQKKRELKAAGIDVRRRKPPKSKGIDYAREIPFQKLAPVGVFDTTDEDSRAKSEAEDPRFVAKRLHELEEKRRSRDEARMQAKDKSRLKRLARHSLDVAVQRTADLVDPASARKRTRLNLPAPQVTDSELEDIAKAGSASEAALVGQGDGSAATRVLMGQYGATPMPTPMRTPRIADGHDAIMEEARNQLALKSAPTPLLGGANPVLEQGTGYQGAAPLDRAVRTPNVLLEGGAGVGAGAGATPMRTPGSTPMATPLHDQLGINRGGVDPTALALMDTPGVSKKRKGRQQASELRKGLADLPQPQYTYDVVAPELEDEPEDAAEELVPDAAELAAQEAAAKAAAEAEEFENRSSALKHDPPLPRITSIDDDAVEPPLPSSASVEDVADSMINAEMLKLLRYDHVKYPVSSKSSKKSRRVPQLSRPPAADLDTAGEMIAEEASRAIAASEAAAGGKDAADQAFATALRTHHESMLFVPSLKAFQPESELTQAQVLEGLKAKFARLQKQLGKEVKRVEKAEQKAAILTGGFQKRATAAVAAIQTAAVNADDHAIELKCFQTQRDQEMAALPQRLSVATAELQDQSQAEAELQDKYARVMGEWHEVRRGRVAAPVAPAAPTADGSGGGGDAGGADAAVASEDVDDAMAGAASLVKLALDLLEDTVTITNTSGADLDIGGWSVTSDVGSNQKFVFDDEFVLAPGGKVTVWSGKHARKQAAPPRHLFWTARFIWNNKGDACSLFNKAGDLVATKEEKGE